MSSYWCHQCRKTITPQTEEGGELICVDCRGDFIEVVEPELSPNASHEDHPANFIMSNNSSSSTVENSNNSNPNNENNISNSNNPSNPLTVFSINLQPLPFSQQSNGNQGFGSAVPLPFFQMMNLANQPNRQANVLLSGELPFQQLMNGLLAGALPNSNPNILAQAFGIHGNPGDYAWGNQFEHLMNGFFNGANRNGNPPASENAMNSLPRIEIDSSQVEGGVDCSICREEFKLSESVVKLPCNHLFHNECVIKWLKMHNQCPVCRFELPTDDAEYEERKKRRTT